MTNRALLEGLKKRVNGAQGTWVDKLSSILWTSRTTPKTAFGESPFSLAYDIEVVLPPEVVFLTLRTENFDEATLEEGLKANLDFANERRVEAHPCILEYKKVVARLYNQRVQPREVKVGDLVLCKAEVSNTTGSQGKS